MPSKSGNIVTDVLNPAKVINQGTLAQHRRRSEAVVSGCCADRASPPHLPCATAPGEASRHPVLPSETSGFWTRSSAWLFHVLPASHRRCLPGSTIPMCLYVAGCPPFLSVACRIDQQESRTDDGPASPLFTLLVHSVFLFYTFLYLDDV